MEKDTSAQYNEINELITNIELTMNKKLDVYQISQSTIIRESISEMLHAVNRETYGYVTNINEYIRNNIKDASFLKKALIEKIHGNMGE